MDEENKEIKSAISEYEKNSKRVQALLFTMISVDDKTKLKVWNKNLKQLLLDMNSSYSNVNLEMVSVLLTNCSSSWKSRFSTKRRHTST